MRKLPIFRVGICLLVLLESEPIWAATANQRNAATHFQRGLQLSADNKWSAAEAEYRIAVQLDPNNPTYHSYLSDALAAQGKFQKAQQSVQQEKHLKNMGYKPAPLQKTPRPKTAALPKPVAAKLPPRIATPPMAPIPISPPPSRPTGVQPPAVPGMPPEGLPPEGVPPVPIPPAMMGGTVTRGVDPPGGDNPFGSGVTNSIPGGEGASAPVTAADDALLERARQLYETGKWLQAATEYRSVLRDHPKVDAGWNGLGDSYFKLGKWSDAETAYRQAVKLNPKEGYYHAQLADALLKGNHQDEAMQEAMNAVAMGLKDHEVFDELGLTVTQAAR